MIFRKLNACMLKKCQKNLKNVKKCHAEMGTKKTVNKLICKFGFKTIKKVRIR